MNQSSKTCLVCGRDMEDTTFLSESFNHSGGTMVFECSCGNRTSRTFVPLDLLSKKEWAKQIAIYAGLEEIDAKTVSDKYNSRQIQRKVMNLK